MSPSLLVQLWIHFLFLSLKYVSDYHNHFTDQDPEERFRFVSKVTDLGTNRVYPYSDTKSIQTISSENENILVF